MEAPDDDGPTIALAQSSPLLYSLPTEIIVQICSFVSPVLISHVSHRLREIVLGSGPLWSNISFSHPDHLITLKTYLERSGESPLNISLDFPSSHPEAENPSSFSATSAAAIVDTIVPHFSRIKEFSLSRLWPRSEETYDSAAVQTVLASQLETLSLILPSGNSKTIFSKYSLHCPNLEFVHLYGAIALQFDQYIGKAGNIHILNITPANPFNHDLVHVLDMYPVIAKNAESLYSLTLREMRLAPQNVPQRIVLKNLNQVAVCNHSATSIFNVITAPKLKEINIRLDLENHDTYVPLIAAIADFITKHSSSLEYLVIGKDGPDDIPPFKFPYPLPILPQLRKLQVRGDIDLSSFGDFGPQLDIVDLWTDNHLAQWDNFMSFVEPISASLRHLRLLIKQRPNPVNTTLSLSFPKLEVLALHGICADSFLTQISSMPCLKELKVQLMLHNPSEPDEDIVPSERGTLVLPALIQLDIPYFPQALLYISAPKLEILHLDLLGVRSLQAAEVMSTFLSRCGSRLTELHIVGCDTYWHPPMSLSMVKSVTLPNLQTLDQPIPLCITPIIDIITPSLESLTIRFHRARGDGLLEKVPPPPFLLPDMLHLSQIRKLTIPSYPDTDCSDILWTFGQVETFEVRVEERWTLPHEDPSTRNTLSQYQSLLETLGNPRDGVPSLPFPELRHLRMRFGGKRLWLPFSLIKQWILARLKASGVTPLARFTLEFEGNRSLSNISYTDWTKQHIFKADWLSEADWVWLSQNVTEFRCHLIKRHSVPELGLGTPWIGHFDVLRRTGIPQFH